MNILKKLKKTFVLPLIGIGIFFHTNFYCFGMEFEKNAIAEVFKTRDLVNLIFEKILWTANNPGEEVCNLSSFAFTNKIIYSKFKKKYGKKLEKLKGIVRRAQLVPLLNKSLVWAPNGIDNEEGQIKLPFLSAYENDSRLDGHLDISKFTHPAYNSDEWNEITLSPENFFESDFKRNIWLIFKSDFKRSIWLITTRAELTRYYKKTIKNNPNTNDPHGLAEVINKNIHYPGNSMLIFYRFGLDGKIDNLFKYKYGEFGPIQKHAGFLLWDYFASDSSRWRGMQGGRDGKLPWCIVLGSTHMYIY